MADRETFERTTWGWLACGLGMVCLVVGGCSSGKNGALVSCKIEQQSPSSQRAPEYSHCIDVSMRTRGQLGDEIDVIEHDVSSSSARDGVGVPMYFEHVDGTTVHVYLRRADSSGRVRKADFDRTVEWLRGDPNVATVSTGT